MKRITFIIHAFTFLLCLVNLSAYSQADNDVQKNIIAKLKAFYAAHTTEKAYLHFDKPYYA
jgi:hypothetical protein